MRLGGGKAKRIGLGDRVSLGIYEKTGKTKGAPKSKTKKGLNKKLGGEGATL